MSDERTPMLSSFSSPARQVLHAETLRFMRQDINFLYAIDIFPAGVSLVLAQLLGARALGLDDVVRTPETHANWIGLKAGETADNRHCICKGCARHF